MVDIKPILPRVEGTIARELRRGLLTDLPQTAKVADVEMAMDLALHAINEGLASAELVLGQLSTLPGERGRITRAAALTFFLAISSAYHESATQKMQDTLARVGAGGGERANG